MKLRRVETTVSDLDGVAGFFAEALSLEVTRHDHGATVVIGSTTLELRRDERTGEPSGYLHLAVNIPPGSFDAAKRWLTGRVELLQLDGRDQFETSARWNATSLYFEAPDGTVLELIMRRDLAVAPFGGQATFGPEHLLGLSEVGVVVPDVRAAVRELAGLGLELYGQDQPGDHFAPVGDLFGLLILVTAARPWWPTAGRVSQPRPMRIEALGTRAGIRHLGASALLVTLPQ